MVFRNDIKCYNTNRRLGGPWKDELDDVSELHIEMKEEAAAISEKDYFLNDVAYKLL